MRHHKWSSPLGWKKCPHTSSIVDRKDLFVFCFSTDIHDMMLHRSTHTSNCLLSMLTSKSHLCHVRLRLYWIISSRNRLQMGTDEETLVILAIFTDQYPFVCLLTAQLGEMTHSVTISSTLYPSIHPSFLLPLPASSLIRYRGSLPAGRAMLSPSERHWRTGGHGGRITTNSRWLHSHAANIMQTSPVICLAPVS